MELSFGRSILPRKWVAKIQNGQNGLFFPKMIKMTQMAWFSKMAIYGAIYAISFALGGPLGPIGMPRSP